MNSSEAQTTFRPKQALAPSASLYDELTGDGMERLAEASLASIPEIQSGAVIHDIGCGTGPGTAAFMSAATSSSAAGVLIKGTDISEDALTIYRKRATEKPWPAEAETMDARALSFPDETFTHAIGSALLFAIQNDGAVDAVKEVHRTLRPGGVAVFNSWATNPTLPALQVAAKATRPEGTPLPRQGLEKWFSADYLRDILVKGGFEESKVRMRETSILVTTAELSRFVTMSWSFIGGTSKAGWLKSDEEHWDEALELMKTELRKTDGFREVAGPKTILKFDAHVATATK